MRKFIMAGVLGATALFGTLASTADAHPWRVRRGPVVINGPGFNVRVPGATVRGGYYRPYRGGYWGNTHYRGYGYGYGYPAGGYYYGW